MDVYSYFDYGVINLWMMKVIYLCISYVDYGDVIYIYKLFYCGIINLWM